MTFVIGDIHGETRKLRQLINYIQEKDYNCNLIFIGDYIDKGNNPKETLDYLVEIDKDLNCVFLMGNHEFYWMKDSPEINKYLLNYGGKQTVKSFNCNTIKEARLLLKNQYKDFLANLVPYCFFENYFICHSGFKQNRKTKIISEIPIEDFLFNRYDFIKSNQLFQDKYKVIFGHTGFYSPYIDSFKIGIDTGACFLEEQPLTAFCLEKEFFLNSNGEVTSLSKISNSICPNIIRSKPWQEG